MENNQEVSAVNQKDQIYDLLQKSLSKGEKFNLISAIIGLIADFIGISTFLAGILQFGGSSSSAGYVLFKMSTALVFVYGWFIVAWVFTRRGLNRIEMSFRRYRSLDSIAGFSTLGVGVFLLPLAIIWYIAFIFSNSSLFPIDYGFFEVVSGLLIWVCLIILMPRFYEDLSLESQRAVFKSYIKNTWPKWRKRIDFELFRYKWIDVANLQDMADLEGVPPDWLEIVLAQYASLYPSKVKYGILHQKVKNGAVIYNNDKKVLANRNSDLENYFVK